jgi:hypothetical protein
MATEKTLTGSIAIIKVNGQPVGLMRNVRVSESTRRVPVRGLGSIVPKEAPVVEWNGTISCSFFEINYLASGVKDAIRRDVGIGNALSTIATGNNQTNFEDNLVLDSVGVQLDIYKKIQDIIDPTSGLIVPKLKAYATIGRCLIESDNVTIDEGNVSGRDQTFVYLDPIVFDK